MLLISTHSVINMRLVYKLLNNVQRCGHITQSQFRGFASASDVKSTCLHDFHVAQGGKMINFGGWSMPVQYKDASIVESHVHTRKHVSIFDVSHMLQTKIKGKDRVQYFESLTPADVSNLKPDSGTLTLFTNDHGGIKDDLIVSNTSSDHLYVVSNAGCIDKDLDHMKKRADECSQEGIDVSVEPMHGHGLIAVQGPEMISLLQPGLSINLKELFFMRSAVGSVYGIPDCRITRCGYTGEDGVEISVNPQYAPKLVERLLSSSHGNAKMAGLGARDSLRLEAGLCLYGHEMTENLTPIEAGLAWLITKRRRVTTGFPGAAIVLKQLKEGVNKKRVGVVTQTGRCPREGAFIMDPDGRKLGFVTSGCPSPSLGKNIAMAYLSPDLAKPGTILGIDVSGKGGKLVEGEVVKMPFVPTTYYTKKAKS